MARVCKECGAGGGNQSSSDAPCNPAGWTRRDDLAEVRGKCGHVGISLRLIPCCRLPENLHESAVTSPLGEVREQLQESDAKRILVPFRRGRFAAEALGRHVLPRAGRPAFASVHAGEPEITELHLSDPGDEDVRRLYVAVDDSADMRVRECVRDRDSKPDDFLDIAELVLRGGLAFDELHRVVRTRSAQSRGIDMDNVRMVKPCDGLRLVLEESVLRHAV